MISQSNIKYNGKSYTVEDTDMITDIINELAAVYSEYDSKIIKFNLTDLKNIIIKSNITLMQASYFSISDIIDLTCIR